MKIIFSILFAFIVWCLLFKFFFDDFDDLKKSAKNNLFWAVIDEFLFSASHTTTNSGGFRFLIFLGIGILGGYLVLLFL